MSNPARRTAGRRSPAYTARGRCRSVRALWLGCALGGLAQSLAGAAGALLAEGVAGSVVVAGLPQTLLVVGAAGSALALGRVTRRYGRAAALSVGMGTAVFGCAVVVVAGLLDSFGGILFGCVLLGAGNTAVMLGRYAGADLAPEDERGRAMGAVLVATTLGAVAGPNLLAPAGAIADTVGAPALLGPYAGAAIGFGAAAAVLLAGLDDPGPARGSTWYTGGDAADQTVDPRARVGIVVLAVANLVMVSVMTMAPIHLHHVGAGYGVIGLVVSIHIAGMFAPSPVSGRLTDRYGPLRVAAASGAVLAGASVLAAVGAASIVVLGAALVLLGVGWNLGLVAGSVLLTAGAVGSDRRSRREAWGEVGMGAAAAVGGAGSGAVIAASGYPALAAAAAVVICVVCALLWRPAVSVGRGVAASVRR